MVHILVLGQSNVANHGTPAGASGFGRVFYNERMTALRDPIPGGSGQGGSVWTRFAPLLRDGKLASDLVITLRAQGGTSVADWSEKGKCYEALVRDIAAIRGCPVPVSHVLYHQGERDTLLRTDTATYVESFMQLYRTVTDAFPAAQWIVCRASYRMGVTSEAVRRAQEEIIERIPGGLRGPDTDRFGAEYRHDNTHFNENGLAAFANDLLACFSESKEFR